MSSGPAGNPRPNSLARTGTITARSVGAGGPGCIIVKAGNHNGSLAPSPLIDALSRRPDAPLE